MSIKIGLTVLGIAMILSLPIGWSISLELEVFSLFSYTLWIAMIGGLLVIICYSFCLAQGLFFLSIGLIEIIEQLVLSRFYPFFAISMFKWYILLINGILFMLGAIIERRYLRGRKDLTWKEGLASFLFIVFIYILSSTLLYLYSF